MKIVVRGGTKLAEDSNRTGDMIRVAHGELYPDVRLAQKTISRRRSEGKETRLEDLGDEYETLVYFTTKKDLNDLLGKKWQASEYTDMVLGRLTGLTPESVKVIRLRSSKAQSDHVNKRK